MVGSSYIDIHTLTLDELAGVVNLYPWYGAARVELCRRMALMGEDWGEDQYAAEALFVPDRGKVAVLLRQGRQTDCSDKDLSALLSSYMEEPSAPEEVQEHQVRAVGGRLFFAGPVRQRAPERRQYLLPLCGQNPAGEYLRGPGRCPNGRPFRHRNPCAHLPGTGPDRGSPTHLFASDFGNPGKKCLLCNPYRQIR